MNEEMHEQWVNYCQSEFVTNAIRLSREDLRTAMHDMLRDPDGRRILTDIVTVGAETLANTRPSAAIITDNPPF